MESSQQSSYLTQVKKLRNLAIEALQNYPIIPYKIEFIKYSANAIFRITDSQNKQYVLRVNPYERHQQEAIQEEIQWMQHILHTTSLSVPIPVKTNSGQYFIEVQQRLCLVFNWLPGKKKWKSINDQYANGLGQVIGMLQRSGQGISMPHRRYWLADGLIGADTAKYHNIETLSDVSIKEQKLLTAARRMVYGILKELENKHPEKTGVIHSDTQPNNILVYQRHFAIIDFDDCGMGFYNDDLAVALCAFEHVAEGNPRQSFRQLKEALLKGYSEFMPLSAEDIQLLPYFMLARKLVTIAWLETHKTNPAIRYYVPTAIDRAIRFYQTLI